MHATNGNGIVKSNSMVDVSMGESENDSDASPKKPASRGKTKGKKAPPTKRAKKDISDGESDFAADSEDEKPKKKARAPKAKAKAKVKKEDDDASDDDDDKPLVKKPAKRSVKDEDATSASTETKPKKARAKKEKTESSSQKKKKAKDGDGEEEEVYKWWEEDPNGDGSVKWNTLEHSGVLFPPPYEPLPSAVKMKYNGGLINAHSYDTRLSAL